ncbi:MAG: glycerol-3-phosphate acyltransferase [Anaerolineales bacterium]|nr:glycerol-3-phosphate acyltransferase [Anaerolineales bacterium]
MIFRSILGVVIGYLLGAIPTGLVVVRAARGRDIRKWYSGRTGATNVMRVAGYMPALITLLGDVFKATFAVLIGGWITGGNAWVEALAGAAAVLGHNYSIFLLEQKEGRWTLQGGAGGASTWGAFFGLWPLGALLSIPVLLGGIYYGIGYASVATLSVPLLAGVLFTWRAAIGVGPWAYVGYAVLAEIFVAWALRPNIQRLRRGEERMVGWRAKRKIEAGEDPDKPGS